MAYTRSIEIITFKGSWEYQIPSTINSKILYPDNLPLNAERIVINGDGYIAPDYIKNYKKLVFWHDSPYVDCNIPYSDNTVFIPGSEFNKSVLEFCNIKNVTEVIRKPVIIPQVYTNEKDYDAVIVLTQPERKGHDRLTQVLREVDELVERKIKILLRVHPDIKHHFMGYRNIEITYLPKIENRSEFIKTISRAKINIFSSYVEGVGLPPIEAAVLKQGLVMGDIDASRENVSTKFARIVDIQLVKHSVRNHYFLYQIWDKDEFKEILLDALNKPEKYIPSLKTPESLKADEQWKKVLEFLD